MRFQPRVDIWALDASERAKLQPGQHVKAGAASDAAFGRFLGERPGSTVVAWCGNAKGRPSIRAYHRALRAYARGTV